MIIDGELELATAQANVRAAGNYNSENTIDLGVGRDVGIGEEMVIVVTIDDAFVDGTSVQAQVITSDSADLSSPVVHSASQAYVDADLVDGFTFVMPIPRRAKASVAPKRYLGLRFVGVGTHTAGTLSARIVKNADAWTLYPQAVNVDL